MKKIAMFLFFLILSLSTGNGGKIHAQFIVEQTEFMAMKTRLPFGLPKIFRSW